MILKTQDRLWPPNYIYYLHEIHRKKQIHYPQDVILKTGNWLWPPEKRFQHFLNFIPSKSQDIVRIGTFGDSYTFGSEVKKADTYPYQLQELFNKNVKNKKVEILNFALPGVSFQEQFFLWEKYSKLYGLDYILLGPKGFFPIRDLTFGRSYILRYFDPPKARFILHEANKIKKIYIKGTSLKEKYKNYYKFIPSLTVLRYDRRPFIVWENLFPFLNWNRLNPFYYKKISMDKEASKINRFLLEKMEHQHHKKILFFTDFKDTFDSYLSIERSHNLNRILTKPDLFYTVFSHESPLGNEFWANIYFNALIGKKDFPSNIIHCYFKQVNKYPFFPPPLKIKSNLSGKKQNINLDFIKSIQIIGGTIPIAVFRHNSHDHHYNRGSYLNHKTEGTKTFIGLSNNKDSSLRAPYIPLPIKLKEGTKIYILSSNKTKINLGDIKSLDTQGIFFDFHEKYIITGLDTFRLHHISWLLWKKMPPALKEKLKDLKGPFKLFVGNYKLGTLIPDMFFKGRALKFIPTSGYKKSFLMMGDFSHQIREKHFPPKFSLYIQYNMNTGKSLKSLMPDWRCKKEIQSIHLNLPNFNPLPMPL